MLKTQYKVDIDDAQFVEALYYEELEAFDRGVEGQLKHIDPPAYQRARINFLVGKLAQKGNHLQAALGHLAHGRKKQIILVLDNADQRTFRDTAGSLSYCARNGSLSQHAGVCCAEAQHFLSV